MSAIAPSIENLLQYGNTDKDTIDYYIFHQANKFILQNLARQLNIDEEKVPMETLSKYGNQCGASIPCAISDMIAEEVSTKDNKILISGFGVGLSWANAIINLNKIYCSKIIEYIS